MIAYRLRSVVRHHEGRDAEVLSNPRLLPLLQVTDIAFQATRRAEIGSERLFQRTGQINRFVVALHESAETLDVVEVVVCDKDGLDGIYRQAVFSQPLLDGAVPDPYVDKEGSAVIAEIIAVAVASTRQAQELHHLI